MKTLTKKELVKYQRQIQLNKFGINGQQKLNNSKVLVVGAGGLGCSALHYLVAAGVGKIGIVDFDTVSESNLQRQIIYQTTDIGKSKVNCAIAQLSKLNEFVAFEGFKSKLNNKNAINIFNDYDVIVDGTDNYETRYLINDACVLLQKPFLYGSVYEFEGQVSVFNFSSKVNKLAPTYRCLFPKPPQKNESFNCSETGVLGVLPGIIGTLQALETIKIITGIGKVLSGELITFNALTIQFHSIVFEADKNNWNGMPNSIEEFENYDYALLCNNSI
ncbi:MAG: HesA/MoeB/ThiF family protein [Bacteroidia bacterium]